tara:strand:+ start:1125 stop:1451 length:327 start_codon:yes stop_codon:yes gene_type:complete
MNMNVAAVKFDESACGATLPVAEIDHAAVQVVTELPAGTIYNSKGPVLTALKLQSTVLLLFNVVKLSDVVLSTSPSTWSRQVNSSLPVPSSETISIVYVYVFPATNGV